MIIKTERYQKLPNKLNIPRIPYNVIVTNIIANPFHENAFCGKGLGNVTESIFPIPMRITTTITEWMKRKISEEISTLNKRNDKTKINKIEIRAITKMRLFLTIIRNNHFIGNNI